MNLKTLNEMKKWLNYNHKTGKVFWIKTKSYLARSGQELKTIRHGYISFKFNQKHYLAHRFAWAFYYGRIPKNCIDHKNGNTLDNRIKNLRDVSLCKNQINQKKHRKGHLPYTTKKGNKWQAQISSKYLGIFNSQKAAHNYAIKILEFSNDHK